MKSIKLNAEEDMTISNERKKVIAQNVEQTKLQINTRNDWNVIMLSQSKGRLL